MKKTIHVKKKYEITGLLGFKASWFFESAAMHCIGYSERTKKRYDAVRSDFYDAVIIDKLVKTLGMAKLKIPYAKI